MMTVVEKDAIRFSRDLNQNVATVDNIKSKLTSRLYNFNSEKDKLYFLSVLRDSIKGMKDKHESQCITPNCVQSEGWEVILYCIQDEYKSISQYYTPEVETEKEFTYEEKINLHNKINDVLENLSHIKMGQEIIFDELDTLRQHFNLDKKSWFQLLQMKLITMCSDKIIDKAIVEDVYSTLSKEVANVTTYIGTQI